MGDQALTSVEVREATEEEVSHYHRFGWVKMERLIPPEMATDQPRWAYIMSYFPRDILFTGAPHHIFNVEAGCVLNQPIDSPQFPTVWP